MEAPRKTNIAVIGGGPVGFAAAIALAKQGYEVAVYEGRDEIPMNNDNSYPIGVNQRGQDALRRLNPDLVDKLNKVGMLIKYVTFHSTSDKTKAAILGSNRSTDDLMNMCDWRSEWQIYAGKRKVAQVKSGQVVGTTRYGMFRFIITTTQSIVMPRHWSSGASLLGSDPLAADEPVTFAGPMLT
jgi:kynurenine 3-monooxygenase